jgi:hypothetical protein
LDSIRFKVARSYVNPVALRSAYSFSLFSHFSAYSVLGFCGGRETKVKGFNTEDTEKGEGPEKSSSSAHSEVLDAGEQNFLDRSGLRFMGIGRMKLTMVKGARKRNAFAGDSLIKP